MTNLSLLVAIVNGNSLFIYIMVFLSILGFYLILRYGSILNVPRNFIRKAKLIDELFDCPICLGFWCGVFIGLYTSTPVIMLGFAASFICKSFELISEKFF